MIRNRYNYLTPSVSRHQRERRRGSVAILSASAMNFILTSLLLGNLETHLQLFRAGSLKLEVERGRYLHSPRQERICKFCQKREIED